VATVLMGASAAVLARSKRKHPAFPLTTDQTEGPFYPPDWEGDADNDLVMVRGEAAGALGVVTHISGQILGADGKPLSSAKVEIWQCDHAGHYRHPGDDQPGKRDAGFQGRGRMLTDDGGRYSFRTIRPVSYPGRTPHIHFHVVKGQRELTTQMYVAGEALNASDGILNSIADPRQREAVIVKLEAANGLEQDALAGVFDIRLA
jgi:protocatechuate 3,4-dioxygenase, beta subunit